MYSTNPVRVWSSASSENLYFSNKVTIPFVCARRNSLSLSKSIFTVWWFPDYCVTKFAETLIDMGPVLFQKAPEVAEAT